MAENVAIRVNKVSKNFRLPHEKVDSVKSLFVNPFRERGRVEVQHALKDISFEVQEGEFFGIVGRNGSGKSTLLKILANIYQPTKGRVMTRGKLVPFIELGVGFNPELTGRENVYLNGALLGFSKKEIDGMYNEIVDFAELQPFMDQKLKNYSSGMQVRLAFSVATRSKADVLLIDEVLAVGDADFQRKCFNYFKQLKKEKTTVVFVTHDMSAVREYCDRAMLVDNSEVTHIGDVDTVAEEYMKLFMAEQATTTDSVEANDSDRWGDFSAKTVRLDTTIKPKAIIIQQEIIANIDMEGLVVGMRIKNAAGGEITGTNTQLERHPVRALAKGETVTIEWSIGNIFSDGEYTVDMAVQYPDGITVCDWWDQAIRFTIKKDKIIPYLVDPGFGVVIKYKSN